MSKRKRRRALDKAPEPQPIRSRALDAFSNVLARLGAGTPVGRHGVQSAAHVA